MQSVCPRMMIVWPGDGLKSGAFGGWFSWVVGGLRLGLCLEQRWSGEHGCMDRQG